MKIVLYELLLLDWLVQEAFLGRRSCHFAGSDQSRCTEWLPAGTLLCLHVPRAVFKLNL